MRKIGLAALTVLELPHHEQVSVAAQAGYTHVGLRLVPVAAVAGGLGHLLQDSLRRHFGLWVGGYVLFWATFYAWYWTR